MSTQTVALIVGGLFAAVVLVLGLTWMLSSGDDDPAPVATASATVTTPPAATSTPPPVPTTPAPTVQPTTPAPAPTSEPAPPPPPSGDSGMAIVFPGGGDLPDNAAGLSDDPAGLLAQWEITDLPYAAGDDTNVLELQTSKGNTFDEWQRADAITTLFVTDQTLDQVSATLQTEFGAAGVEDIETTTAGNSDADAVDLLGVRNGHYFAASITRPNEETTSAAGLPAGLTIVDVSQRSAPTADGSYPTALSDQLSEAIAVADQAGLASAGWEFFTSVNLFNPSLIRSEFDYKVSFEDDAQAAAADAVAAATDAANREDGDTVRMDAAGAVWTFYDFGEGFARVESE